MENQNKIHRPRTLSCQYQHFRDLIFKIEMFDLHAVSIFATGTCESDTTTPFFCKLWNTIHREIINIMTIMMKTIQKPLNLNTKYILMGWGPVYY